MYRQMLMGELNRGVGTTGTCPTGPTHSKNGGTSNAFVPCSHKKCYFSLHGARWTAYHHVSSVITSAVADELEWQSKKDWRFWTFLAFQNVISFQLLGSNDFAPRLPLGLCLGPCWGTSVPKPLFMSTNKNKNVPMPLGLKEGLLSYSNQEY